MGQRIPLPYYSAITSRQQQTQHTVPDWLRAEFAIEKLGNKLLAMTGLDSDTWVGEVRRIRGKKQRLTAADLGAAPRLARLPEGACWGKRLCYHFDIWQRY
jgi:hypothetical protein